MKTLIIKCCSLVVFGLMLTACGGGGGNSSDPAAPVAPAEPAITVINISAMVDGMMAEDVAVDDYSAWDLDKFDIVDDMDNVEADITLDTMITKMELEEAAKL